MKILPLLMSALLYAFSIASGAAATAQMRFTCLSLRFQPGSAGFGSSLALSSVAGPPNGELYPTGGFDYASGIILDDGFGFPVTGTMHVNLPAFQDANGNGFDDFFEVAQGIDPATTTGTFSTGLSDGTITAQWNRSAGMADGTCVLNLEDNIFGDLGNFAHAFAVIEYTGALGYASGASNVTVTVNLTQTGNAGSTLVGPALFSKTVPGDFDHLILRAGSWTNASAQAQVYEESPVSRDLLVHTNYYGYVAFADGDPNTAGYDYPFWLLSIDDGNDADADSIPDFSDAPAALPRHPVLALARNSTNLWLTISGEVGRLHHLLASQSLTSGNWLTNLSLTLTNDPQTVSLPLPDQATAFWRVLVP